MVVLCLRVGFENDDAPSIDVSFHLDVPLMMLVFYHEIDFVASLIDLDHDRVMIVYDLLIDDVHDPDHELVPLFDHHDPVNVDALCLSEKFHLYAMMIHRHVVWSDFYNINKISKSIIIIMMTLKKKSLFTWIAVVGHHHVSVHCLVPVVS